MEEHLLFSYNVSSVRTERNPVLSPLSHSHLDLNTGPL